MSKPKLTLPTKPEKQFASWNCTLHRMLAESWLFDVEQSASLPQLPRKSCGRVTQNFSAVMIDDLLIGIDTWDTNSPTETAWREGFFDAGEVLSAMALVLKIQHEPLPLWDEFTAATQIPINAWTIFPTREYPLEFFRYDPNANHIYIGTLTGADRYGRTDFKNTARERHDFYALEGGQKDSLDEYLNIVKSCRWGISLRGKRGTDGKNRREIEFASCGIPLALNYQPHYPFPFEPGKHYIYLRDAGDLAKLRDIDPQPYAEASWSVYQNYWSVRGMARLFVTLVEKHCRRKIMTP